MYVQMYMYVYLSLFPQGDKGQADGRMTRSGAAALKSPEVKVQQKGKGGGKKRGRKRKAEESSYKISDFVDSQVSMCTCTTCTYVYEYNCAYMC